MALIHALDRLENHPRRPDLLAVLQKLAAALERHQDPRSGRWFQVMDKGSLRASWTETSCSSMHAYVLARAVAGRHLPPRYAHAAAKGYRGVLDRISLDPKGQVKLDGISVGTSVGDLGYYLARRQAANDPHGLGAFLIMHEQFRGMEMPAAAR
jgi:unsaturated rhamnogalacturonyl hydrolase